jgi:cell wall-associated NlpC family hydrolase
LNEFHLMTVSQPLFRTRKTAQTLVLLVSLMASSTAWSTDVTLADSGKPLSKLQELSNRASELALQAMGMLGIHYKYGGTTPEGGLDCSGLVQHIFKEAWGKELPRTSVEISKVGQHVDKNDLQPGDLVFYNTLKRGFSHVGIYLGDRKFIHSPSAGGKVRIESMDVGYWKKRFNGGRRISDPEHPLKDL